MDVPEDLADALIANPRAQAMFQTLTSANRYSILYRIGSAKKLETRARRIEQFVEMLARGETIHPQGPRVTSLIDRRRRRGARVARNSEPQAPPSRAGRCCAPMLHQPA